MTPLEDLVIDIGDLAAAARRDARLDVPGLKFLAELGTVIAAIGDQERCWWQGVEYEACALEVAHLAFGQQQYDRTAFAVADGMQLGVQPALGSPNTTGTSPF